jgi:hypothetical protein
VEASAHQRISRIARRRRDENDAIVANRVLGMAVLGRVGPFRGIAAKIDLGRLLTLGVSLCRRHNAWKKLLRKTLSRNNARCCQSLCTTEKRVLVRSNANVLPCSAIDS